MNLFFLDQNPITAATFPHDRDIKNGITDVATMLAEVWWAYFGAYNTPKDKFEQDFGVKLSTKKVRHPMVQWLAHSRGNYRWGGRYLQGLLLEHSLRFEKDRYHSLRDKPWITKCLPPLALRDDTFTFPPQLVSDDCIKPPEQFVEAYREFYGRYRVMYMKRPATALEKPKFCGNLWTKRQIPEFVKDAVSVIAG